MDRPHWHPAAWRPRLQGWWLQRLGRSDQWALNHRNVYILPTRAGLVLGLTLLVLLVASINYQLSLGYLLTFLLAGTALSAMHVTHRNLRGLSLQLHPPPPVHAGQQVAVTVVVHNSSRLDRHGVGLGWWTDQGAQAVQTGWTDVAGQDRSVVVLGWHAPQRGRQHLPNVCIETRYPLGVFRAWSWWRPATTALVYPRIESPCPPWPTQGGTDDKTPANTPTDGSAQGWAGLRPYRAGDPLKHVAWKQVARRDLPAPEGWVTRERERPPGGVLWLDAASTGVAGREAQASRLCAWVVQAEQLGLAYGLRLPHVGVAPDRGASHQQRCLEALALW